MLSLLGRANTGDELLSVLDSLMGDNQQSIVDNEPTLDVIDFWYLFLIMFWSPKRNNRRQTKKNGSADRRLKSNGKTAKQLTASRKRK